LSGVDARFGNLATLAELSASIRAANVLYQADDYAATTNVIPGLVADTATAVREYEGDDRTKALEAHAQALQLAGSTLIHLRQNDLAYEALRQAQDAAEEAGNDVLGGSVIVSLCWLLLRQNRLSETERVAVATAEAIEPSFNKASQSHLATWGWLLLRASAAAVRNNRHDEASDLMRLAAAAAARIGQLTRHARLGMLAYRSRNGVGHQREQGWAVAHGDSRGRCNAPRRPAGGSRARRGGRRRRQAVGRRWIDGRRAQALVSTARGRVDRGPAGR